MSFERGGFKSGYDEWGPDEEVPVYYCEINSITDGDLENGSCWTYLGDTDEYGVITVTATDLGATVGEYVVAIPGQEGAYSGNICSTPGGIIVEIAAGN